MPRKRKVAPPPPGYLTVHAVAKLLGVSTTTAYRRYPHWYRPSPRRVIAKQTDVVKFVQARKRAAQKYQPYKEMT